MVANFPFLTSYDPPGTSEGTLDPLGLYQIADQLAVQLVPAVRERMQRIRFLTAMAIGALVTENLQENSMDRDATAYLVWEWLVVEALIRTNGDDPEMRGVPGTSVAKQALSQHTYLDSRSYLKTPRIFGFHGVYKRLATYLRIVDVHLSSGPAAQGLVDVWARDRGLGGLNGAKPVLAGWTAAVKRSLAEKPRRTRTNWGKDAWADLAAAFAPNKSGVQEKRFLRKLVLSQSDRQLGALPAIWQLLSETRDKEMEEESLHDLLKEREPKYGPLLAAIRAYEAFARSLQDAFDLIRSEAAGRDAQGLDVPTIARNSGFITSVNNLHKRFESAHHALGEVTITNTSLQVLFDTRFREFAMRMDAASCALVLCSHHETVQQNKSADGKRPWFDRLSEDRIYLRHAYRVKEREIQPNRYVHAYRTEPIRRFQNDLT